MSNINVPQLAAEVSAINLVEEDAPQIDYTQIQLKAPVYKYRQLQQVSGGSALTLSANSTTLSQYNCPNIPFNLAESYITLDMAVPAGGVANQGNVHFVDSIPLNYVKFKPEVGDPIVDIQNAQMYTKVIHPLTTPLNKYLSRSGVYVDGAVLGGVLPLSEINGCQPYSAITDPVPTTLQIYPQKPSSVYITNSGLVSVTPATFASGVIQDEKAQQRLAAGIFGQNATTCVRYKIPLSAFGGTLLALDKTICFGGITQLYLQWQPIINWGFNSLNTIAGGAPPAQVFAQPVISNYYLYLAEDISESGREIEMIAKTSGLSLYMPFTTCSQYTAVAGVQDVPLVLTPGTGYSLKRIITVPSNNTQTLFSTCNTDNVSGVRFTEVQSYLDSKPLQDYKLNLANGTLWNHMSPLTKNTPIGMGQRTYEIGCFFMDNFSDASSGADFNENDFKASGLSITQPRNYSARFTLVPAASIVYIYATWLRRLVIKPSGLSWAV
jgi:hypothetical protein